MSFRLNETKYWYYEYHMKSIWWMVETVQSLSTSRDNIFATGDAKLIIHCSYAYTTYEDLTPAQIYLFNINSRNTRKRCEICSKLTIKISERRQWLSTYFTTFSTFFSVNFKKLNICSEDMWSPSTSNLLPTLTDTQRPKAIIFHWN